MEAVISFLREYIDLICILFLLLFIILFKPARPAAKYVAGNTLCAGIYVALSAVMARFGMTLAVNAFTLILPLALGIPGVSLALVLRSIV